MSSPRSAAVSRIPGRALATLLLAFVLGCGSGKGSTPDDDAGARDGGSPPRLDAASDPDLGSDPGRDADTDAGLDPGPDAAPDPRPDAGPDPGSDAGPLDAGTGAFELPAGALHSVSIGESWTEGQGDDVFPPGWPPVVGDHVASVRPGSRLENFACSGWSAPQLLSEGCSGAPPIERVEAASPDLVLVLIGANDITDWQYEEPSRLGDYDPVRYETALREVHDRIAATGARVVQVEVPDITRFPVARGWSSGKRATIDARIRAANTLIAGIVAEHGGLVVPLHAVEALYDPSNYVGDGLHMNHAGYSIVGEAVWRVLEPYVR